ncbi:hypothetical protein F4808DRAFT_463300 [Astrocystis sublimbata]|nr:hypothetical protein F4808DRAFT_463300 [Astrocystis sublimbata]
MKMQAMTMKTERECLAVLRGEGFPDNLAEWDSMPEIVRRCTLRGIRHHDGFGDRLRRLYHPVALRSSDSSLLRTLHARDIMSNRIPDMKGPDEYPYCIWYPDVASEGTYCRLAERYPAMRYLVGRACAVAGYNALFRELDLLPEVSIAEEARDNVVSNNWGSRIIYDAIMNHPLRYSVLDDYTRGSDPDNPRRVVGLNGDTTVVSRLRNRKQSFRRAKFHSPKDINITEDGCVHEEYSEEVTWPAGDAITRLLYSPLPTDLPAGEKNVLILMAAYNGDVDRYHRLRRPYLLGGEEDAVVRGIYHNTMFAMYKLAEVDQPSGLTQVPSSSTPIRTRPTFSCRIRQALYARLIMNNDLSRITDDLPKAFLPNMICHPDVAHPTTYQQLARIRPEMIPAVAQACIVANYPGLWDALAWTPSEMLFREAKASPNPHYLETLTSRAKESAPPPSPEESPQDPTAREARWNLAKEPRGAETRLFPSVSEDLFAYGQRVNIGGQRPYINQRANPGCIELFVSVPEEHRLPPGAPTMHITAKYASPLSRRKPPIAAAAVAKRKSQSNEVHDVSRLRRVLPPWRIPVPQPPKPTEGGEEETSKRQRLDLGENVIDG